MNGTENNGVAQSMPNTQQTEQKPKGNGGLNALLFIGSFLIVVGSCSLLMSTVSDMIKLVILLIITVVFYVAGLLIRRIEVLIPAGTAFLCTSLAVMPFMGNAFSHFAGMSDELSWFFTSLLGTAAYIIAALVMKSRIVATVSIGFLVSLFCSAPTNLNMSILWTYLAAISVGIIANTISVTLKEKVPSAYRDILSFSARIIASLVAFATIFGIFSLKGFDYTIIFAICFTQFVLSYVIEKKYVDVILARIAIIPLILSVVWQLIPAQSSSFAIISGMVFISEVIYSLLLSIKKPEVRAREIAFIVPSLVLAPFCSLFAIGATDRAIGWNNIAIIILSIELILTICFAYFWKNKSWLFGAYPIAAIIPLLVDGLDDKAKVMLVIYILEMIIFFVYYYLQKVQLKGLELFNLIFYTVVITITRLACSDSIGNYLSLANESETIIFNLIALVIPAFLWVVSGLKNNIKIYIEIAFYLFMLFVSGTAIELFGKQYEESILFIIASTVVFCLGITSYYKKTYWRAIVGTAIYAFIALQWIEIYASAFSYGESSYAETVFQIFFLVESIFISAVGAVKRRWAIFWIATPLSLIIAFTLTSDFAFIWFILIGLALIGFVIWRLLEGQKKAQQSTPNGQTSIPNSAEAQTKEEKPSPEMVKEASTQDTKNNDDVKESSEKPTEPSSEN